MAEPQIILIEEALDIIDKIAKELRATARQEEMLDALVRSVPVMGMHEGSPYLYSDSLHAFIHNFMKAVQTGDSTFLRQKRGLCVDRVVDIVEFVESNAFMKQGGYVWKPVLAKLIELFEGGEYVEGVLTGAIGVGKNYFADLAVAYMLYVLSCYHNPQIEFGLAPGSSIVFIMQSMSYKLAKKVAFGSFAERLKLSPYFSDKFTFDRNVKSELRFPKNIYVLPVGGADTAAIGMNVYGGIIDEMNFMARTRTSVKLTYTGGEEYDQAEQVYRTLIRRMKSRFMNKGKLPGKLLLVSSVNYPGDFTSRKIEESATDKTIFVMNHSQWEALPPDRFGGEKFLVELGSDVKQSKIIENLDEAKDEDDVIEVPTEYRPEFDRDLEAALRDIAGVATGAKHPFIPQRDLIEQAQVAHEVMAENRQLFLHETVVISELLDIESPDWELLVDQSYIDEVIFDPKQVFACHIDPSLSNDAAGLAIGRITGYKLLPSLRYFDERTSDFVEIRDVRAPIYTMDGTLRIVAPRNGEVELELVRDLVLWLRGQLFIKWATLDSYQSAMMIQSFRRAKIRSGVLSVDTSMAPYAELKQAIKDERILYPRHAMLGKELRNLERDVKRDKVEHPEGQSKDVSDAVAGTVYLLQRKEATYGKTSSRRKHKHHGDTGRKQVRKVRLGRRRR